jgi:hypothetical protein
MALADRVNPTMQKRRPSGTPCSVQNALDTWPEDDAKALQWMMDEGWSMDRIYATVTAGDEGYEIGRQTIQRHRSKSCRCYK